uniref:Zinc-finger domain-containing protein n=1 Tax=Trichuris muris TaxID=70415 RepID=A0A5S6QDJ3_TRIMR
MSSEELEEGEIVDVVQPDAVDNNTWQDMDVDFTEKANSILVVRNKNTRMHLLGIPRRPLITEVPRKYEPVPIQPDVSNISTEVGTRRSTFRPHTSHRRRPLLNRDDAVRDSERLNPHENSCTFTDTTGDKRPRGTHFKEWKGQSNSQPPCTSAAAEKFQMDSDEDASLLLLRLQLLESLNRKEGKLLDRKRKNFAHGRRSKRSQKRRKTANINQSKCVSQVDQHQRSDQLLKTDFHAGSRVRQRNGNSATEVSSRPNLLPTPRPSESILLPSNGKYTDRSCGDGTQPKSSPACAEKDGSTSEGDHSSEERALRLYLIANMLENRRQKALLNQGAHSVGPVVEQSGAVTANSKKEVANVAPSEAGKPTCSKAPNLPEAKDLHAARNAQQNVRVPLNKRCDLASAAKPLPQGSSNPVATKVTPWRPATPQPKPPAPSATTSVSTYDTAKQLIPQSHPLAQFIRKERLAPGSRQYVRPTSPYENGNKGGPPAQTVGSSRGGAHSHLNTRSRYKWTQAKSSSAQSNPTGPHGFRNISYRKDAYAQDKGYVAFVQQKQKPVIVVLDDGDSSDEEGKGPPSKEKPAGSRAGCTGSAEDAVIAQAERDASEALLTVYDSKVDTAGKELRFYEQKLDEDKQQLYVLRCQQNEEELCYRKSLALRAKLRSELEKLNQQIDVHRTNMDATNNKIRVLQDVIEKGAIQRRLTELKWKSVKCASTAYKLNCGIGDRLADDDLYADGIAQKASVDMQTLLDACNPKRSLDPEEVFVEQVRETLRLPSTEPEKNVAFAPVDDSSPLMCFRSYRLLSACMAARGIPLSTPTLSNNIDPMVMFCPYALDGICAEENCPWQHPSDYELSQKEILFDLLSYHPEAVIDASGSELEVRNRLELYCKQLCQSFGQTETTDDLMKFCVTRMKKFLPSTGVCLEKRRFVCRPKRRGMKRCVGSSAFIVQGSTNSVSLCQLEDATRILNTEVERRSRLWRAVEKTERLKKQVTENLCSPELWREFLFSLADVIDNKVVLRCICDQAYRCAPGFHTRVALFAGCATFSEAADVCHRCLHWLQWNRAHSGGPRDCGRAAVVVANFLHSAIQLGSVSDAIRLLQSELLCPSSPAAANLGDDAAVSVWLMLIHVRLTECLPNSVSIRHCNSILSSDITMPWAYLHKTHASLLYELLYLACSCVGSRDGQPTRHSEPLNRICQPLLILLAESSTKERLMFWVREAFRLLRCNEEFVAFLLFESSLDVLTEVAAREEVVQACLKIRAHNIRFKYYWLTLLARDRQWGAIVDFDPSLNAYVDEVFPQDGRKPSEDTFARLTSNVRPLADELGSYWEAYLLLSILLKRIGVSQDVNLLRSAFDDDVLSLLLLPAQQLHYLREVVLLARVLKVGKDFLVIMLQTVLAVLSRARYIKLGSLPTELIGALVDFVCVAVPERKEAILKEMLFRFGEADTIRFILIDSLDADSQLWCHLVQSSAHCLQTIDRYLTCIRRANQSGNRLLALFVLKHGLQAFPTCQELTCQLEELRTSSEEADRQIRQDG